MKRLLAALVVAVLTAGLSLLVISPASAHTPNFSAGCNGVRVQATAYDAGLQNRWSVTIAGVTKSGTFGASFDQTFPVPQGGATTSWSAFIEAEDGTFHGQDAGTVGPCGAPVDECVDLPGNQPVGTACTPPPDVDRTDSKALEGCDVVLAGTSYGPGRLTYDERFTDTYVFNSQTNSWDLVTDTTATIANVHFTPWSVQQQVANGCADMPAQPPAEKSSRTSSYVDCDADAIVTTTVTTTTPYVYDAASNGWVPGEPHSHTTTTRSPVQPGDCDASGVSPSQTQSSTPVHAGVAATVQVSPTTSTGRLPKDVPAGLAGSTRVPARVTAHLAAPVDPAAPGGGNRLVALALMVAGTATVALGGRGLRRS